MKFTFRTKINLALGAGLALLLLVGVGSYTTVKVLLDDAHSAQDIKLLILSGGLVSAGLLVWAIFLANHHEAGRRRAQARLSDSPAISCAVTEIMGEGVVTATADGLISHVNLAGLKLFGYQLHELLGRPAAQLMPARYRPGFEKFFGSLVCLPEGIKETGRETMGLCKNGDEIALQLSFGDVAVDGRRLFTFVVHDVTEIKRISKALRASESQLRQMIDTVPALMAYVDAEQVVQFHNRACEESLILNHDHDQVHGKTLRELLGSDSYESARGNVEEALAGYSVNYERSLRNAQGILRDYDMQYFPRYGEGDQEGQVIGFFVLGNDITELKRIDRMKSEFVSTVSHELRTPLTSIRGSLGLIAGGVAGVLPDKAKGLVHIAKDNCERLVRLINDILDSEKIESGKMRFELRINALKPLLEQALAANEGFAAQHQVTLALDAPDDALLASIDSDRFTQVVTNLLSNAVKFSPPQAAVQVRLLRTDGRVRVEVHDQGSGIPEEFRLRIFQNFSQVDSSDTRQKGGTGLGLNISRAIIERMGGRIDFSSEVGVGTTFFFELPESQNIKPAAAGADLAARSHSAPRPRILVCDGDPDVARLIVMMLDKGDFDADTVNSAAQALELLAIQAYAAMTVDLRLPGQDGVSLIRALRDDKHTRALPIVVVSAMAEEGRLQFNNQPLMVSGWLEKPIDENRLIRGLRRAIAGIAGDKPRILHVEDDKDVQRITAAISQDLATFVFAATLEEARMHLRSHMVDAVLLDLDLGPEEVSGSSLFVDIARLDPAPPVVIFSASEVGEEHREHATAILLKAKTSDDELRATLARVLACPISSGQKT